MSNRVIGGVCGVLMGGAVAVVFALPLAEAVFLMGCGGLICAALAK